jgi:hypothetical protein
MRDLALGFTVVLGRLEATIRKMQETEQLVLGPVRAAGFDYARFEAA